MKKAYQAEALPQYDDVGVRVEDPYTIVQIDGMRQLEPGVFRIEGMRIKELSQELFGRIEDMLADEGVEDPADREAVLIAMSRTLHVRQLSRILAERIKPA